MLKSLLSRATVRLGRSLLASQCERIPHMCNHPRFFANQPHQLSVITGSPLQFSRYNQGDIRNFFICKPTSPLTLNPMQQWVRNFHAKGSKVKYLDFRHKFNTSHYKSHLLIIRKQKMKKHQRTKWRKKFKCLLAKKRLKREIVKEKTFRVELLTMIKRAEQFDPREYALRKIHEANNVERPPTKEERYEQLKELIRINRYQVDYIKPKHRRLETLSDYVGGRT